jgi:gamma-glutamylcyclotransferase (GGCT)/AIG2-like uncharacterized protein YtfP
MSETVKFFVYGTLKKGGRLSGGVAKYLKNVEKGIIRGKLYNVGAFPAVILGGETSVKGEIHEFESPEAVHKLLDRIEGCYGNDPNNLYNKEQVEVLTQEGTETCYVYEFNRPVEKLPVIESGEWEI